VENKFKIDNEKIQVSTKFSFLILNIKLIIIQILSTPFPIPFSSRSPQNQPKKQFFTFVTASVKKIMQKVILLLFNPFQVKTSFRCHKCIYENFNRKGESKILQSRNFYGFMVTSCLHLHKNPFFELAWPTKGFKRK
jgi:hypothetical protein